MPRLRCPLGGHSRTVAQPSAYAPRVNELEAFEQAVAELGPRFAVFVGSALSPDGRYGVALTLLPTANDYLMDDLLERTADGWELSSGGNGGGLQWTSLKTDGTGVLRFSGEAPANASFAHIAYEGQSHVVPIRNGHFFFVAWDTLFTEDPQILDFK